jgi:hypothetical protein
LHRIKTYAYKTIYFIRAFTIKRTWLEWLPWAAEELDGAKWEERNKMRGSCRTKEANEPLRSLINSASGPEIKS